MFTSSSETETENVLGIILNMNTCFHIPAPFLLNSASILAQAIEVPQTMV